MRLNSSVSGLTLLRVDGRSQPLKPILTNGRSTLLVFLRHLG